MGQAKVRKLNGTYRREVPQDIGRGIGFDRTLPICKQPHTEEVRNWLISMDTDEMGANSRKATAYHESGHAVLFELAGIAVDFVTAFPIYDQCHGNGWLRGAVKRRGGAIRAAQFRGYAEGILAGDLALEKAGFGCADIGSIDHDHLERVMSAININSLHDGTLAAPTGGTGIADLVLHARRKLDDPQVWAAIESLAARLRESEVVQGDEVREIVESCCPVVAKAA